MTARNEIGRQVEAARKALRNTGDADVVAVATAMDRYHVHLVEEGLTDADLAVEKPTPRGFAFRGVALLALLPLALVGMVLYALPYQLPRLAGRTAAKEPDEISTRKIGAGLVVFPLWAAGLFAWLPLVSAAVASASVVIAPFAALAWLDRTPDLRRSLRMLTRTARIDALREERGEVLRLVEATRVKLGL
jgi:hypothetical protein